MITPEALTNVPPIFYILGLLLLIGPIVTLHEYGHYLAGRLFGVHSEVFSFGFGKEIVGVTDKRGTRWRISAIPLGGYVRFAGDANAASMPTRDETARQDPQALTSKPLWQRAIVAVAGPAINLISAALIFALFLYGSERFMKPTHLNMEVPPVISAVIAGGAGEKAGFKPGDVILSINGKKISRFKQVQEAVMLRNGQRVAFEVQRSADTLTLYATPDTRVEKDKFGNIYKFGFLNLQSADGRLKKYSMGEALVGGIRQIGTTIESAVDGIKQIILGRRPISDVSGMLRMSKMAGEVLTIGWEPFLQVIALVSVSVGVLNLLPIPTLDGGHLLLYALEGVTRRPLNQRLLEAAYVSGYFLIICLMIFTFWNDLQAMGAWSKLASLIS